MVENEMDDDIVAGLLKAAIENHMVKDIKDLPRVIQDIRRAFKGEIEVEERVVEHKGSNVDMQPDEPTTLFPKAKVDPAVPVGDSVKPEYLVCLNCGKNFKSLKRHIGSEHRLSPEAYKRMWNLPVDYPMVAPNYAEARSKLALELGLGRKPKEAPAEAEVSPTKPSSRRTKAG